MTFPLILATIGLALNQPADSSQTATVHPLQSLIDDASALRDVYSSPGAQRMLDGVEELPICEPSPVYAAWRPNRGYTQSQYDALDDSQREGLRMLPIESVDYYSTFYGTPLVYARILDLVELHSPGFVVEGARIMDLGYGQLGQLRLWAQMGADVVGVEIDPILTAIYDGCQAVGDVDDDPKTSGSVALVEGAWPNDESCRKEVGGEFDLIISRNLLKRGYVKPAALNPAFPVPVGWEMSDAEVVGHFYDRLRSDRITRSEAGPGKAMVGYRQPMGQGGLGAGRLRGARARCR
jgi:hypothetical protein